jgi:peptide/nickel transport system permease protein
MGPRRLAVKRLSGIATALTRRLIILAISCILCFGLVHLTPGNPCTAAQMADAFQRRSQDRICRELHLDLPLHRQFFAFIADLVSGKLRSWARIGHPPVLPLLADALVRSLPILILVTLLVWTASFPLGLYAACRKGERFDRATQLVSLVLISTPTFVIAYGLLVLAGSANLQAGGDLDPTIVPNEVSVLWRWTDRIWHAALPSLCLAIVAIAFLSRYVRAQAAAVMRAPHIDLARLRGLPEQHVRYGHVLRNALLPAITQFGFYVPWIVGGTVVVEIVFAWPGLGRLVYDGFQQRDYPVVLGANMLTAALVVAGNALADALYAVADPRVRAPGDQT